MCSHLQLQSINQSIDQSIKTDLYSAVCHNRIRGARWQGLGGVSSVKQFYNKLNTFSNLNYYNA